MRIITWNCHQAYRKKASFILKCKPDILIVPECEDLSKLTFPKGLREPTHKLWFGENRNKGLGVFSYSNLKLQEKSAYNSEFKTIIPIAITGGNFDFILYAIWAKGPGYIEQIWDAIEYYNDHLSNKQTMLIGDFNSNTMWDKEHGVKNHSNVVKHLEEKGIYSCYHSHYRQQQGHEHHPTFFHTYNESKSYHIDYCFASEDLLHKLTNVKIGSYTSWIKHSDHVPLIVNFDFN